MSDIIPADHGPLNDHAVGIILKEVVRRAIVAIRARREVFEVMHKDGYERDVLDVFTNADKCAQDIYMRTLKECFPNYGYIAEEGIRLMRPDDDGYFTIDPLDGTKAFIRRQSHGIGTMIAMVKSNTIVSAFVGDINTREIYGYRPGSHRVHRITDFETSTDLRHEVKPLAEQYLLLRDPPSAYQDQSRELLPLFKSYQIEGGSIGTWMARLWKGEVGGALLPAGVETPWDSTPVRGISRRLGYRQFYRSPLTGRWSHCTGPLPTEVTRRSHDLLILHKNNVEHLGDVIG